SRGELYSGINVLTVFNGNTPVLERLVYNDVQGKIVDHVQVSELNRKKDSLIMSVSVPRRSNVSYDLSISVLPGETRSYTHHDNMISTMLLKPYVKGFIERSGEYFRDVTESKRYDLDVLLLTQGWSRYNWNNIFNHEPKVLYDFNRGLVVRGRVQSSKGASV
ncbi:hypothetical protein M0D21_22950, partial [Aquimarina sp. D1M17]|nr:hypothetical protein [Aquimarina acroporae]